MDQKCVNKLLELQEKLRFDPAYQALCAEHRILNARFLETVNALEESQRDAIFDYLGLILEMHNKMLELACLTLR